MKRYAIVLAAGKGTRMHSDRPKVLHALLGKPMLAYVLTALSTLPWDDVFLVVGHGREAVQAAFADAGTFIVQDPQRGTGDAVRLALEAAPELEATFLVIYGDAPLIRAETVERLIRTHEAAGADATALTATVDDPRGFGRVVRDAEGRFLRIVEEKDADSAERLIREINVGLYAFYGPHLAEALGAIRADNAQGEYYLTDVLHHLLAAGRRVATARLDDPEEAAGINDRLQLAAAEQTLRRRILTAHMRQGVTIEDPASTWIGPDVMIERDTVVRAGSRLFGETRIGRGCEIGPQADLADAIVGDGVHVWYAVARGVRIDDGATVGPFAHLRPGAAIGRGVRIGNFVEVKNSTIGEKAKVPHLSYVGDAIVGREVNVGCGTITVNYDGVKKHATIIGDGAFIGCNTNLVAPVTVGDGAYVAAGSTITDDVPGGALAVARARQVNKERYVERLMARFGRPSRDPDARPESGPKQDRRNGE
ncbi:MAG: bifunctional UDP-N-acetylglucosamine diphosphorylase/glucosamine-1-phosphate N-acetyltransferase GlmU [Hydrogenibacillus sp.]|nr:bifunctional UDP-N-acetylglucosamine diphosphorylase/glucosamine-1-phosphate N-acetyltransferase GlmU [Hydrogenibacillus sp.]